MNLLRIKIFTFSLFTLASLTTKANDWSCGDTLIDSRDGQKYPTIQIGNQCWMARNLNIGAPVPTSGQLNNNRMEKTCYNNQISNCDTLGGLYTWDEAMQYAHKEKSMGVCPAGWHIPSLEEWNILHQLVPEGRELKARETDKPAFDGNNKSGFSAIPAGLAYYDSFGRKGNWAIFWTSTPSENNYSWSVEIDKSYIVYGSYTNLEFTDTYLTINAFSIRCIKD